MIRVLENSVPRIFTGLILSVAVVFFAYFAWRSFPCKGIFDFVIFLDAAKNFIDTGILYNRENIYAPGMNVYKFPPLFAGFLVVAMRYGMTYENLYNLAYILHIAAYVIGVFLLSMQWYQKGIKNNNAITCFSVGLCFFPLLDVNILCLQLDIYIFLLLVIAYCLVGSGNNFFAGFVLSLGAMLKIYPVVMLFYLIFTRKHNGVLGFGFGILVTTAFCLYIFGITEVERYFLEIMPILLTELPMPGSADNVAFPALFSYAVASVYVGLSVGSFDADVLAGKVASGMVDAQTVIHDIAIICQLTKVFSQILFAGIVVFMARIFYLSLQNEKNSDTVAAILYGSMVASVIIFMQNSWTNYQIHLLIPILIVLGFLNKNSIAGLFYIRGIFIFSIIALWFYSWVDTAHQHVNHFERVPGFFRWLALEFSGLTVWTRFIRCAAALAILYVGLALASRLSPVPEENC